MHGDGAHALEFVSQIRKKLTKALIFNHIRGAIMGENLNQNPNQEINPNEKEFKFTKIIDDYCTVLYS